MWPPPHAPPHGILAAWLTAECSSPRRVASGAPRRWAAPSSTTRSCRWTPSVLPRRSGKPTGARATSRTSGASSRRDCSRTARPRSIAEAGLDSLHRRMRATTPGGEVPIDEVFSQAPVAPPLDTVTVTGTAARTRELSLPFHGERLRGDALHRQLDAWVSRRHRSSRPPPRRCGRSRPTPSGSTSPGQRRRRARCRRGDGPAAGAPALGRRGGRGRPAPARRVEAGAGDGPAARRDPARAGSPTASRRCRAPRGARRGRPAPRPAADRRLAHRPGRHRWCSATTSTPTAPPTCGSRWPWTRSASELLRRRDDVALAFLATPTDVFAVPAEAVDAVHPRLPQALGRHAAGAAGRCGR